MTQMFRFDGPSNPPSPGQILKDRLLDESDLTQAQLARAIGISCPRLNMIIKGRCPITPEIALRIERVFDIAPQYWLRIRTEFELYEERQRMAGELENLPQLSRRPQREASVWRTDEWQAAA